ncbi:MAG: GTPase [Thiolinea sp.]
MAFAGRSNSGKSSTINRVCSQKIWPVPAKRQDASN